MKRSKIFLGITTCFLAVAAIAATKAHRNTVPRYIITTISQVQFCTVFVSDCLKKASSFVCHTKIDDVTSRIVYTNFVDSHTCSSPLTYTTTGL
jgi:hypothetical protein